MRDRSSKIAFKLREIAPEAKLADEIALQVINDVVPLETIHQVISASNVKEKRRRSLPTDVVMLLCIAMNFFAQDNLEEVLRKMTQGLRYVWPDDEIPTATKGAISKARYKVGSEPMAELLKRVCQPIATAETKGAFYKGLRLMAIDGTYENVPDTKENNLYFGRPNAGDSAFPQLLAVYLLECGTHAVLDLEVEPCNGSERAAGLRLLRSVGEGDLLTWDRGFHSFDMAYQARQTGADFLGRVPSNLHLRPLQELPDGSYLAYIYPSDYKRKKRGEHLLVRVIDYTLNDPQRPGHAERHRLITSLMDYEAFPALDLACAYHERWEIEITIDELDTHQRLANQPFRSQKPEGVLQELYGLIIAHYAIRTLMHNAAVQADLDPDRISFINTLHVIRRAIPEFQKTTLSQHPRLYERMLREIARHVLPERDNRSNPRVVKRKMSKFKRKRPIHRGCPKPSKTFREAVVVRQAKPNVLLYLPILRTTMTTANTVAATATL